MYKITDALKVIYHGICQYCGDGGAGHADHIIPKSRGGSNDLTNFILACQRCNLRKGAGLMQPQFIALISAIAERNQDRLRRVITGLEQLPDCGGKLVHIASQHHDTEYLVWIDSSPTMEQATRLNDRVDLLIAADKVKNGYRNRQEIENAAQS